jgi:hypothetical protein
MTHKCQDGALPKDLTAEKHCLAAKLLNPELQNGEFPPAADFFLPEHQALARCIHAAHDRGNEISPETIHVIATERNELQAFGGDDFLIALMEELPHGARGPHFAKLVKDKAIRRRLYEKAKEAAQLAADDSIEVADIIEHLDGLVAYERNGGSSGNLDRFTIGSLCQKYPTLHPVVIDGLLRRQETANVISVSKVGKSWLAYNLALCVATGRAWLDVFATTKGRVLIVDNELHRPTLAHRIPAVAKALSISADEYGGQIEVWPIRGKGMSILDLEPLLRKTRGEFQLVILDAKYRFVVPGKSENDNAAETAFYNAIDKLAEVTESAFVMIHHSSKGSQTDKRVTDVGSGAGAQSRAADTHIVLREHEDADCVVLDAAVRSFKPVDPIGLRWQFPLWVPDQGIDPEQLKGRKTRGEEAQNEKDREADNLVLDCCQAWKTRKEIKTLTGMGYERTDRSIARLKKSKLLDTDVQDRPRHPQTDVYRKSINAR